MEEQKLEIKIKDRPLAFTDIETTGVEPVKYKKLWYWPSQKHPIEWHEIIEIGLVLVDQKNHEIISKLDVKIKPARPERMTESALKVTGYDIASWQDAVSLAQAMTRYGEMTKGAIFCAHNVTFDWSFIDLAFQKTGVKNLMDYHRVDMFTMAWDKLNNKLERFSQKTINEFLGVPPEPMPHRAINGAMAAYQNYQKLISL